MIIECAYFNPESIINKAVKYDITSEAAHKFERGVDPECHIEVLRRFIKIVQDHAEINKIELFSDHSKHNEPVKIEYRTDIIQNILGIKISDNDFVRYLNNLGFKFIQNFIEVPSYRSDIITHNDIAEEIARSIGYDNIPVHEFDIGPSKKIHSHKILNEEKIKDYLLDNGYHEVINNPFEDCESKNSITLDNPLDSSRRYLRTNLKNSLINNLLYNERRQKDSVKLFEISNVYSYKNEIKTKKILGIIASGRIGKNYRDFSKRIDKDNFQKFICDLVPKEVCTFDDIPRYDLNSKSKTYIAYVEIDLNKLHNLKTINYDRISKSPDEFVQYKSISEFPVSTRDLSFSIKDPSELENLNNLIESIESELLKDVFIFDYYVNDKLKEIKIGYRFTFQSKIKTITINDVDKIINNIIKQAQKIHSVTYQV